MGKVNECVGCSKIISVELGYCWDCWNAHRVHAQPEHYCTCGIDITAREFEQGIKCTHPVEHHRKIPQTLDLISYETRFSVDADWTLLELKNTETTLNSLIDQALAAGEKSKFFELTEQLKKVKSALVG